MSDSFTGPYTTNGVTVSFPFDFDAPSADEVAVVLVASDGSETVQSSSLYSVSLNSVAVGGTVTFSLPPASGFSLFVLLDPEMGERVSFSQGGAFLASSFNDIEEGASARARALKRGVDRAVKMPYGEEGGTFPPVADRANRYPVFDAVGNLTTSEGTGADSGLRGDLATSGLTLIGTGDGSTLEARLKKLGLIPQQFGAVPDALFQNPADGKWYSDAGFVTEATDNSTALQDWIDEIEATGQQGLLAGAFRVVQGLVVDNAAIIGFNPAQENSKQFSALCGDHALTSVRNTADNDHTNAILRVDNSADAIGGSRLEKFSILGNTNWVINVFNNRCDRVALEGYYAVNGDWRDLHIAGFSKSAVSNIGPCQDRVFSGWIHYCGENDGGTDTTYAIEHQPSKLALGGGAFAAGRSPNAIHYHLHRINHCPAYILHNHGTSYLGEISYHGKLEHADFQYGATYGTEDPLVSLLEGGRAIHFAEDMHMTIPRASNKAGSAIWAIDIKSNRTRFSSHVRAGGNNTPQVLRMARAGALHRPLDGGGKVDGYFENMPTSTHGLDIRGADFDATVHQDLSTITGNIRNGVRIGRGAHGRLTYRPTGIPSQAVSGGILAQTDDLQYPASTVNTVTASAVGGGSGATFTVTANSGGSILPNMSVMDSSRNIVGMIAADAGGSGGNGDYTLDITTGLASGTYYIGYAGYTSLEMVVDDYGGGIAQVNQLYGNGAGTWRDSQHLRLSTVTGPRQPRITSAPSGNLIDLRRYGTGLIVMDYGGAVVDGLIGGSIGQTVTLYAKTAFTINHGTWNKLANEENTVIAANEAITLVMQEGRVAMESGRRSGVAVSDLNQTISGTYTQSEVQAISDKVDELAGSLRDAQVIKT